MEGLDYLQEKPSQLMLAGKKSKYGTNVRCSATLRKRVFDEARKNRDASVVLKHVSVAEGWEPNEVEDNLPFDDGDLKRYGWYSERNRNKTSKAVITQIPNKYGAKTSKPSYISYSMNKKKRWLLPAALKEEIYAEKVAGKSDLNADIDVTVIQRAVGLNRSQYRPDAFDAVSTALPEKENDFPAKKRKRKQGTYSWATDLLGLSSKPTTPPEVTKPEIAYEFCHSRLTGPYQNEENFHSHESKKKGQCRQRKRLIPDDYRFGPDSDVEETDVIVNDEVENGVNARQPLNIASWINHAQSGKIVQHRVKRKKCRKSVSSKKGEVIYQKHSQESQIQKQNKQNLLETIAADVHFQAVLEADEKASSVINLSVDSLYSLSSQFFNDGPVSMFGVTARRSSSRPVKYAFQMEKQIVVKVESGEVKSALSYLIVEPLSDPSNCSDKSRCLSENGFCVCHPYLPTKLKLRIQSDEKLHQECVEVWKQKLDEILFRPRHGCVGMYLEKVLKMVCFTYNTTAEESFNLNLALTKSKKYTNLLKTAPYKRKVTDKAYSLLGFSFAEVSPEDLTLKDGNEDLAVIENNNPRDFCEICFAELSEDSEEYRATALLQCKHWFCHDCWRRHLTTTTRGAATQPLECPGYGCSVVVDDATLMAFLPGDLISRYRTRHLKNTIKRSENFHTCPQCANTVEVTNKKNPKSLKRALPLSCSCGMRWCSHCKEEPHWPASCSVAEAYRKESKDTTNIIKSVSGRRCPKCHERIEKNGGCQMVTCICSHTFCWNCMQSFDECMYECRGQKVELESWDVTSKSTRLAQAMFDAKKFGQNYESTKTHRRRLAACNETARKKVSVQEKSESFTFESKLQRTRSFKDRLHLVLIHCDALHHIIQYLTVEVAWKKQNKSSLYPKMNRFLNRLIVFVANIEISLFENSTRSKDSFDQILKKKISASVTLMHHLAVCTNCSERQKKKPSVH